jgi:hypothetical protein
MGLGLAGAMLAVAIILEFVGFLGAVLLRALRWVPTSRAVFLALSLAIAAIHTVLYVGLFGAAFAAGDAGQPIPFISKLAVPILGTPLMHVLRVPPMILAPAGRWWGDDSNFIIGLAILNGLIWGFAIGWLIVRRKWRGADSAAV